MPDVVTQEGSKIAPESGVETSYTVESFLAYPDPPAGAKDIQRSHEDGKFTLRYTVLDAGGDATYTINGSVSQEPLATHAMFRTGDFQITDDEWKKWKLWDADPHDPELSGWKPDNGSNGMKKYYAY